LQQQADHFTDESGFRAAAKLEGETLEGWQINFAKHVSPLLPGDR
jgi:hypothetical protein